MTNGVGGPKKPGYDPFTGSGLHDVRSVKGFENFGSEESRTANVWTTNEFERVDMNSITVEDALKAERKYNDAVAEKKLHEASYDRVQTRLVGVHSVDVEKVDDSVLIAMAKTLATSERKGILLRKHVAWSAMPEPEAFGTFSKHVAKMAKKKPEMPINTFIDNMAVHMPKSKNKPTDGTGSGGKKKHLTITEIQAKYGIHRFFTALVPKIGEGVVGGVQNLTAKLMGVDVNASAYAYMGASIMPSSMMVSAKVF